MKIKFTALPLLLLLTCIQSGRAGGAGGDTTLTRILEDKSSEFISTAVVPAGRTGPLVFKQYAELVMMELRRSGEKRVADQLERCLNGQYDVACRNRLAWMLHAYARVFYRDDIISATSRLIQFRTFATDVRNRLNPEFVRQKTYLQGLAEKLGLGFRDIDGFVQEIWVGDGGESFGLMVHTDVRPVEEKSWTSGP
ncbi:MAG TPA: hypothetical protein VJO14_04810 [Bacteroidota bacterium]|nr:hypothetical protein [Bacteroidota bacterium]